MNPARLALWSIVAMLCATPALAQQEVYSAPRPTQFNWASDENDPDPETLEQMRQQAEAEESQDISFGIFGPTLDWIRTTPGVFYVGAEAWHFRRNNGANEQQLAVRATLNPAPPPPALFTDLLRVGQLDFPAHVGHKYTLGYLIDHTRAIEFSAFWLDHWTEHVAIHGNNDLQLPGTIPLRVLNFTAADEFRYFWTSRLESFELNYFKQTRRQDIQLLVGLRHIDLREGFVIRGFDPLDGSITDYDTQARNHLFGLQFGTRFRREFDLCGVDLHCKLGPMANRDTQTNKIFDFGPNPNDPVTVFRPDPNVPTQKGFAKDLVFSFVADFGINATHRFDNEWMLKFGYNVMFITGVALGPDQLDFNDTSVSGNFITSGGTIFMHGANVGLVRSF